MATNRTLAEAWTKKCSICLHAQQEQIDEKVVRRHRKTACQQAGLCVCRLANPTDPTQGPKMLQLCERLGRKLKELCPKVEKKSSPRRLLLEQRNVVLAFADPDSGEDPIFFHIGYLNLKTFHFAGQVLHEASELRNQWPFARETTLQLRVKPARMCGVALEVYSDLEFIQSSLELQRKWDVRLFQISALDRDWLDHEHYSDLVPVTALADLPEFHLWLGADEPGPQPARRTGNAAGPREPRAARPRANPRTGQPVPEPVPEHDEDDGTGVGNLNDLFYVEEPDEEEEQDDNAEDTLHVLEEQAADEQRLDPSAEHQDRWDDVEASILPGAFPDTPAAPAVDGVAAAAGASFVPTQDDAGAESAAEACGGPSARATSSRDPYAAEVFSLGALGCLRYYPQAKKLAAVCYRADHQPDCRISRATTGSECQTRNFRGQGRPIGRLVSWLQKSSHEDFPDCRQHVHKCNSTFQERSEARAYFETLPGAADFALRVERPQREGESSEPEHIR